MEEERLMTCHRMKPVRNAEDLFDKKEKKCIRCGEPCYKTLCRKCFESPKTKHKGQLARIRR